MPDDLAVVLAIQIEEKRQSKVFAKNWQHAKKPGSPQKNKI